MTNHINIDGIENALQGIWNELEKLNQRLSPYYEGKCDDCGEKVLLLKESYKEQINLGWYHALRVFHGSVQNPAFGDTDDLCNGIIEIGEESL